MKRFLVFIGLFPALALVGLFAFISIGIGVLPDNPQAVMLVPWAYVVGVIPALICAVADRFLAKTGFSAVIGTAFVGYVIAILVALLVFDFGLFGRILAFGLIGAIPAAVCSWLSSSR